MSTLILSRAGNASSWIAACVALGALTPTALGSPPLQGNTAVYSVDHQLNPVVSMNVDGSSVVYCETMGANTQPDQVLLIGLDANGAQSWKKEIQGLWDVHVSDSGDCWLTDQQVTSVDVVHITSAGVVDWQENLDFGYQVTSARFATVGNDLMFLCGLNQYDPHENVRFGRLDVSGTLAWEHDLRGVGGPMHELSNGDWLLVGTANDVADPPNVSDNDMVAMRFAPNGSLVWQTAAGGPLHDDRALGFAQTDDGGVLLAGNSSGGATWFAKVGSSGSVVSQDALGLNFLTDFNVRGVVDGPEGAFVFGDVGNQPDDSFVIAFDEGGALRWQRMFGSVHVDRISELHPRPNGGCFLVGRASLVSGIEDAFVTAIDAQGNVQWSRRMDLGTKDQPSFATTTQDGGLLVAGATYGLAGTWVVKLKANGKVGWKKSWKAVLAQSGPLQAKAWEDGGSTIALSTYDYEVDPPHYEAHHDLVLLELDAFGKPIYTRRYADALARVLPQAGNYVDSLLDLGRRPNGSLFAVGIGDPRADDFNPELDLWFSRINKQGKDGGGCLSKKSKHSTAKLDVSPAPEVIGQNAPSASHAFSLWNTPNLMVETDSTTVSQGTATIASPSLTLDDYCGS